MGEAKRVARVRRNGQTRLTVIGDGREVSWLRPSDVAARLLAMRAQIDEMLAALGEGPKLAPVRALYMTSADYAKRRNVSESTVKRWIKGGLPHSKVGRTVRIEVAPADAWVPA